MQETYTAAVLVRGKGIGFVPLPEFEEDILIERDSLGFALDGDIVKIELKPQENGKRREGKVLEVVKPAFRELIGTVKEREINGKTLVYLAPDNHRIHVRPVLPDAADTDIGMKVAVEISSWKSPHSEPIAAIVDTLGKAGDHETEIQAILRSGGFAQDFPPDVQEAAETLYSNREQIFKDAVADPNRRDLREVITMTIDPADAKDFDDALSVRQLESGNVEIGIHIADVSHYVRKDDVIDKEARERATSVYLVDRVIPMLPEVLSNDLCSLRPHEDRLAFSAIFEITPDAKVVNDWFGQTIINSNRRYTYQDAQATLDTGKGDYYDELTTLMTLGRKFRQARYKAGAIAFEQPEVQFELDERGASIRVYKKDRIETMLMIEDFMLLANQRVATHIFNLAKDRGRDHVFVYRIHDVPNPDKIDELSTFLHALGYDFEAKAGIVEAKDLNELLKEVEGTPEENLIKTATIRTMAKAIYSTKNIGHFGLAFKYYTHFTSPIRRYPDLLAHRILRRHLDNSPIKSDDMGVYESLLVQSTKREIEAVSAERDSIKFKQTEYMVNHVGEEFDGVITGVADWGIYVQEINSLAEGMIKLSSMKNDFFEHEASKYRIKGQRTGTTYQLGDEIQVKLVRADTEERQLDFELVVPQP